MTGDKTQPIAIYGHRRHAVRCHCELFPDTIHVYVSNGQKEVDTTFSLAQLDPFVMRIWEYSQWFFIGMATFAVAIVLLLVVVTVVMTQDVKSFPTKPMELVGTIAALGITQLVMNHRKIEYAYFRSGAGVSIIAIPYAGKDRTEFDGFVELLTKQIRLTRAKSEADTTRAQQ